MASFGTSLSLRARTRRLLGAASVVIALTATLVAVPTAAFAVRINGGSTTASGFSIADAPSQGQVGTADAFPSTVTVSDLLGVVTAVTITLFDVTHPSIGDIDAMLVSPTGQNYLFLSDAGAPGSRVSADHADLRFWDGALDPLAKLGDGPVASTTYGPINNDAGETFADTFPTPAPRPSSAGSFREAFNSIVPNGTWSLYIVDDSPGDAGSIGGWKLSIQTRTEVAQSDTTITSSQATAAAGTPVTFTAAVESIFYPLQSGSVRFSDGATVLGTVALNGAGTASLTTSTLAPGTHTITADYLGATGFATSSATLTQQIDSPTSTLVVITPNPASMLDSILYLADVSALGGGGPVTTGTVAFTVDGVTVASAVPVVLGRASLSAEPTVGTHTIVASYSGAPGLLPSTSAPASQTVNGVSTTTTLSRPSIDPVPWSNERVAFTATVVSGGGPVTEGSVEFFADGASLGAPVAVDTNGVATLRLPRLPVGALRFTAVFTGTPVFASSGSAPVSLSATDTRVTSQPARPSVGQLVTYLAVIDCPSGSFGDDTVQFFDGATAVGYSLVIAGVAGLTVTAGSVGTHSLTAVYSGSSTCASSSSPAYVMTVSTVPTATALTSSASPSIVGLPVTFTATVTSDGAAVTSGTVQFHDGATLLGVPVAVGPDGTAVLTTSALAEGTRSITATFSGTPTLATSVSPALLQSVSAATATATTVTSDASPALLGEPVTFTAAVTASGAPVGSGTVQFYDDGTALGSAVAVASGGTAALATATLGLGSHAITAVYSGAPGLAASTGAVTQLVNAVEADAGGPYTITEGDSLVLDASGSTAGATYEWDLDDDGVFADATGASPTVTPAQLAALGLDDGPSDHAVAVRVSAFGSTATATATLHVDNTAPTTVLTGPLTAVAGQPFTIKVGADDASAADMAAQFTYRVDWGDGSPVVIVTGPADPPVTHTYAAAGTYAASFVAVDKDGGSGSPTGVTVVAAPAVAATDAAPLAGTGGEVPVFAIVISGVLVMLGVALLLVRAIGSRRRVRRSTPA